MSIEYLKNWSNNSSVHLRKEKNTYDRLIKCWIQGWGKTQKFFFSIFLETWASRNMVIITIIFYILFNILKDLFITE